jgi:acetylornithine deacetylase/succinyl-diaminopimelate desuccinylase-like protein
MAGLVRAAEVVQLQDRDGVRLGAALARADLDAAALDQVARDDMGCLVELHIEQGPILERAGVEVGVGVVETIVGIHRMQAVVLGQADHAGTTPLDMRADALLGAADVVLALPELVQPSGGVVTVGQLDVAPGSSNVVPGRVLFSIDLRHPNAADALGHSTRRMVSGAGHDAMAMAARCPVAMIFAPCRGGFSHRPDEFADAAMIAPGTGCSSVLWVSWRGRDAAGARRRARFARSLTEGVRGSPVTLTIRAFTAHSFRSHAAG